MQIKLERAYLLISGEKREVQLSSSLKRGSVSREKDRSLRRLLNDSQSFLGGYLQPPPPHPKLARNTKGLASQGQLSLSKTLSDKNFLENIGEHLGPTATERGRKQLK